MDKNKELQVIKTVGDDGEELELKVLEIVSVEDNDYALLLPADADIDDEDNEIVLMKIKQENDEYIFETIEDDDEFEAVAKILSDEECTCGDDCSCHHHE